MDARKNCHPITQNLHVHVYADTQAFNWIRWAIFQTFIFNQLHCRTNIFLHKNGQFWLSVSIYSIWNYALVRQFFEFCDLDRDTSYFDCAQPSPVKYLSASRGQPVIT